MRKAPKDNLGVRPSFPDIPDLPRFNHQIREVLTWDQVLKSGDLVDEKSLRFMSEDRWPLLGSEIHFVRDRQWDVLDRESFFFISDEFLVEVLC